MSKKKQRETIEAAREELARAEKWKQQEDNRIKVMRNKLSQEERKARTRRLIKEGSILEHYIPEFKEMSAGRRADMIRVIACGRDAMDYLLWWKEKCSGERENEKQENMF